MEYGGLLDDLRNVAIIIPGESGTEWHNQVGCVSCRQASMEGWLEILWNAPTDNFGCDTHDLARLRMGRDLMEYAGDVFESVYVSGYTEAWLNITFTLFPRYLAQHPEVPYGPGEVIHGILTYENCD